MMPNIFDSLGRTLGGAGRFAGDIFGGASDLLGDAAIRMQGKDPKQMQLERQHQELRNQAQLAALKDREQLMQMIQDIKQSPPGPQRDAKIQEYQMIMGFRVEPSQQQDVGNLWQQWQKNKNILGVEDLSESERLILEQKNKDLMEQIQGAEGYTITEKEIPGKESRLPFGWGDVESKTEYGLEKIPRTAETKDVFEGVTPSPMRGEIDVFEQLMTPKKTVKELQKQKSRDPTDMELSQIYANAKVPRFEITKEVAKLKSIWSELELEEKLTIYELLAQGRTAQELIEHFKKQNKDEQI